MYKINKWLFKFIVKAEFDYAKSREIKHLDKYKIFHKRRTYLSNVLLEINNEEMSNDND